jgi:predicted ArsR family transcriptional regulator
MSNVKKISCFELRYSIEEAIPYYPKNISVRGVYKQIESLGVTERTVRNHLSALVNKELISVHVRNGVSLYSKQRGSTHSVKDVFAVALLADFALKMIDRHSTLSNSSLLGIDDFIKQQGDLFEKRYEANPNNETLKLLKMIQSASNVEELASIFEHDERSRIGPLPWAA